MWERQGWKGSKARVWIELVLDSVSDREPLERWSQNTVNVLNTTELNTLKGLCEFQLNLKIRDTDITNMTKRLFQKIDLVIIQMICEEKKDRD